MISSSTVDCIAGLAGHCIVQIVHSLGHCTLMMIWRCAQPYSAARQASLVEQTCEIDGNMRLNSGFLN